MNIIYLHLGANKGKILKNLLSAFKAIETTIGPIVKYSKFYKTAAWGNLDQADFINVALKVHSAIEPEALLVTTQQIEASMGRNQTEHWGSREIDIDILYFNQLNISTEQLTIPHPLISERNFVLIPMMDLDTDYCDPLQQKTIEELYLSSRDESEVILL